MKVLKFNIRLFWLILLFNTGSVFGQNGLNYYKELLAKYRGNELEIPDFERKADSLLSSIEEAGLFTLQAEIAHQHALTYAKNGDFSSALKYGGIATSVFEERDLADEDFQDIVSPQVYAKGNVRDSMHVRSLYNYARFYLDNLEYEKAITRFEQIIALDVTPLRTYQAYVEIARSKDRMGDFFNAIRYYERGIDYLESLGAYQFVANHSINLAVTYRNIGTPESMMKSRLALERADSLRQIYPLAANNYTSLMIDLASQYASDKSMYDLSKATTYYKLGLDTALAKGYTGAIALVMNNLAHVYNLEKRDSALYFALQGLTYSPETETRSRLLDNITDYYLLRDSLDQALIYGHKALTSVLESDLDSLEVPDPVTLSNSRFKDLTIELLQKKTDVLIRSYQKTGDKGLLTRAIRYVRAADELIDMIQSISYENQTRLLWRKAASEVYVRGTYAAHMAGRPDMLFYFLEKNKALLLSEEVARNTAYAGLPRNISDRSIVLKRKILKLENEEPANKDSLFDARVIYETYLDSVRQAFPDYFRDKLNVKSVSLEEWQQSLQPETTFMSFIWNKLNVKTEVLIGVVVTHDQVLSFAVEETDILKSLVNEYQMLISQPMKTKTERSYFFKLSHALFEKLFPDSEVRRLINSKRLIIVPDGPLQSIPFEALVPVRGEETFLIENTDVSYLYSVSFLDHNRGIKRDAPEKLIAYAPIDFPQRELITLKKTRQELMGIEAETGGVLKLEDAATKDHFLSESKKYSMIHLATHANANEAPWIAFADDKMGLYELYTYRNNAQLVTLSACNTLLGEVASGEGVLSLSRGFFYSGAESVVASLWNVDDQSTSTIMADFYANLEAGQDKSAALNNAKRSYLKTHSLAEQSPYYWSSFVLMGDDDAIESSNFFYGYLLVILIVSTISFIYMKKKRKT